MNISTVTSSLKIMTINIYSITAIYLLAINFATFVVYGIDKRKAKKNRWRISERTLIVLAIVGGSIGAVFGMKVFHHKTKHKMFTIGIPAIIFMQLCTAAFIFYTIKKSIV